MTSDRAPALGFLSQHFTFNELTATRHNDLIEANRAAAAASTAVQLRLHVQAHGQLELIRRIHGRTYLSCGYRFPDLNERVGGAADSQHLLGEAVDIVGVQQGTLEEVWRYVWQHSGMMFGQVILEAWGAVHLSLGFPFRELEQCGHVLRARMVDRGGGHTVARYDLVEQVVFP